MENVSLIGHSMGSIIAFLFSSVFPEKVKMAVGIDTLKPLNWIAEKSPESIRNQVELFLKYDKFNRHSEEPPVSSYEELAEKWIRATNGSITKETVDYILQRNTRKSLKSPGKFYISRDNRIKSHVPVRLTQEVSILFAKRIQCPFLFIKGTKSPFEEVESDIREIFEVLRNSNSKFELHFVDAAHHLHLTHPELVAPILKNFMLKYL